MEWVLDASMALAWAFPDEKSSEGDRFLRRISKKDILWVPFLWWYEMANALVVAQRKNRISEVDIMQLQKLYGMLPIETDMAVGLEMWERLFRLAKDYTLSVYDAAYLELAIRKGIRFATLDQNLKRAAQRAGLRVFQ